MNIQILSKKLQATVYLTGALALAATPSLAAVNLAAVEGEWTSAVSGETVPMWGFVADTGSCPGTPVTWSPGPELTDANLEGNGDLVINLRNCLSVPTSIVIPGLQAEYYPPVRNGNRIVAFTKEAPANNGTTTTEYRWLNVAATPGSYLYQSGSHAALQVHMGLYGAVKSGVYDNTAGDLTLLYSEIDPALHATGSPATPLTYKPRYFLVNGEESLNLNVTDTTQPTVLSFLNAGLEFHVPQFLNSYMELQAEDGNPYPFAKEQYSVKLAAGKTIDAFWQPVADETYTLFDRHGNNMVVTIAASNSGGAVAVANDDVYGIEEGGTLAVDAAGGVLANDNPLGSDAELLSSVASGALNCGAAAGLCADGSFTYTPDAGFVGQDFFTYQIASGSNTAYVTINVSAANHAPIAVNDNYSVEVDTLLDVPAPGVLGNDSDPDGNPLTVTASDGNIIQSDGSISETFTTEGQQLISYTVCDNAATPLCANATAIIDVTAPVVNEGPVALDDAATTPRNTSVVIDLTANDTDPDGINDASLVTQTESRRRGTIVNNGNGTVTYTPRTNWRGTDTFTYTVNDTLNNVSNEATVRVNVTR